MDPRDRLWVQLIFPRCDPRDLLALRVACRAFLAQLSAAPARLWQPLTLDDYRMSYAERTMGWASVAVAMERERVTRANCDTGRFVRGATLDLSDVTNVFLVAGCVVVFLYESVRLFSVDTGAAVAVLNARTAHQRPIAVLDRWVAFGTRENQLLLLDCVSAQLTEVCQLPTELFYEACGAHLAYDIADDAVAVVHIGTSGPDLRDTIVRVVARIALPHRGATFALCQRGRAFLLHDMYSGAVQLRGVCDNQLIRSYASLFAAMEPFTDCDHFIARDWSGSRVAVRIRDERVSPVRDVAQSVVLCCDNRVFIPQFTDEEYRIAYVKEGTVSAPMCAVVPDTSGALLWAGDYRVAMLAGHAGGAGVALPAHIAADACFRYGVAVVHELGRLCVLRFDVPIQ